MMFAKMLMVIDDDVDVRDQQAVEVASQNNNALMRRLVGGLARRVFAAKSHAVSKLAG